MVLPIVCSHRGKIVTKRLSEFELIAKLFAPLATDAGACGLKDDAAILHLPPGHEMLVTTDALVGEVHFLETDPPETIARKALGVNISDLAAKGATPTGFFLAIALPAAPDMEWLEKFTEGLGDYSRRFHIPLMGGDTTSTPGPLTLTITAMGHVPAGTMPQRAGARPGDKVFVSGSVGDSGGGLQLLQTPEAGTHLSPEHHAHLISRYRIPVPRLELGQALRPVMTASLDVSDGLMADLGHIADTSAVAITVRGEVVPRSAALRTLQGEDVAAIIRAVTAGDDYELAFTATDEAAVMAAARATDTPVTCIGEVTVGSGVHLSVNGNICPLSKAGWQHF